MVPLVLALAAVSPAQAPNPGCGGGKLVLSVSYHVANDVDTGVQGNNWAFDTYDRSVRVWRKARGRFCSASSYSGEFTSIAGPSPGGKSPSPTFAGVSSSFFTGFGIQFFSAYAMRK